MTQLPAEVSTIALGSPWTSQVLKTSAAEDWNQVLVETHSARPELRPAQAMDMHVISALVNTTSRFERKDLLGRKTPYSKTRGVITITPADATADFDLHSPAELIHVGLDRCLVRQTRDDAEHVSLIHASQRIGVVDRAMSQIVGLLQQELEAEAPVGRLYVDSLATALAARYLVAQDMLPITSSRVRPLSKKVLARITQKMQESLAENLSLESLAQESGYSSAHFLRMFRAATGSTPHSFFLDLRLERARHLLQNRKDLSIVTIAGNCGFSTQSHFTQLFRRRFGATPAGLRRERASR